MSKTTPQGTGTQGSGTWEAPKGRPEVDEDKLAAWIEATSGLRAVAERDGLSKSEVARRSGVPMGTLSPWYDGTYAGDYAAQTERVQRWLRAVEEGRAKMVGIAQPPGFLDTPTSREVIDTLLYAQMMPEMVVIVLGSGMGKTTTADHYEKSRPNTFKVTMRPTTGGTYSMLQELGLALDVTERNPARLDRAIGLKLKRNGRHTLLMVDEAQNLADNAVNQLRYFLDEYGCGIALLGNEEVYSRFGKSEPRDGYGQIHRRIGKRVRRLQPLRGDIEAILDGWSIADPAQRRLLSVIGKKPGALGQIEKTIRLAMMIAVGAGRPVSVDDIRSAWINRGGDDLRVTD